MKPLARKENLVVQEIDGEILVYDLLTNKAVCLNQNSAIVWEKCNGKSDVAKIARDVSSKLNLNVTEDYVWFAIDQLEKENLLAEKVNSSEKFNGLSRREVIKKIGLTSMVALPIVASLVAPMAAYAISSCPTTNPVGCPTTGSGRPSGCACSGNGNCMSGTCIPASGGMIACCA